MTRLDEEGLNRSPGKKQLWQERPRPTLNALAPPPLPGGTLPLPLLPQSLTVASRLLEGRSRIREFGGGRPRGDRRIRVQALGHLVADEVDEALEGLLHVDVVLGAGLEELETFAGGSREQSSRETGTVSLLGRPCRTLVCSCVRLLLVD